MDQYCFAGWRLSSFVVVICNATGMQDGRPPGTWTVGTPAAGHVGIGWATLHGGPVWLRPVRATPCFSCCCLHIPTLQWHWQLMIKHDVCLEVVSLFSLYVVECRTLRIEYLKMKTVKKLED